MYIPQFTFVCGMELRQIFVIIRRLGHCPAPCNGVRDEGVTGARGKAFFNGMHFSLQPDKLRYKVQKRNPAQYCVVRGSVSNLKPNMSIT